MIALLFFNWYGYRIVIGMLAKDADRQLETRLDNNDYHESQLVEFRIPLNIPYQPSESPFERCYGEIEIAGKYYTYVKRKIENGQLILKCITNNTKEQIKAAGNDYFKRINGLQQPDRKTDNPAFSKQCWSDYDRRTDEDELSLPAMATGLQQTKHAYLLHKVCLATPHQPPEPACI